MFSVKGGGYIRMKESGFALLFMASRDLNKCCSKRLPCSDFHVSWRTSLGGRRDHFIKCDWSIKSNS